MTDPHAWQDLAERPSLCRVTSSARWPAPIRPTPPTTSRRPAVSAAIAALDDQVRSELAEVPPARRKVVTSHDAFGYFGAAYGVEFVAPQGISEDAEPSAADLKRLIDQIRARAHQGPVPRERAEPAPGRADRPRDRCRDRRHALRRCALRARRPGADLSRHVPAQRAAAERGHARRPCLRW